jgi:hypothetical protein
VACFIVAWLLTTLTASLVAARDEVRVGIAAEDPAAMRATLTASLDGFDLLFVSFDGDIEAALAVPADAGLARLWLKLGDEGAMVLVLSGDGERGMLRRLSREDASDEVLREEIALVVATAVHTLANDRQALSSRTDLLRELGPPAPAPPSPAPPSPAPPSPAPPSPAPPSPAPPSPAPPSPAPPSPAPDMSVPGMSVPGMSVPTTAPEPGEEPAPPPWRLGALAFYEGQGFAKEHAVLHGPGVGLGFGAPELVLAPRFELTAQYRFSVEVASSVAGLSLQSGAFRLSTQLTAWQGATVLLRLVGGLGIDLLRIEPFLVDPRARPLPARTRVAPMARFGVDVGIHLHGDLSLRAGVGADVDAIGTRYVVQDGDTLIPLLDPLRVRPLITVGVDYTLLGRSAFSETR